MSNVITSSGGDFIEDRSNLRRVLLGSTLGSVVEFYDYGCYGYLAVVIGGQFFPTRGSGVGLLLSLLVFSLAFVVRPLGGVIFGHLGDRLGRKKALTLSIVMITGATVVLGLLPTYAQLGMLAPVLLTVARLVQGISAGGETSGAVVYGMEAAHPRRRGFITGVVHTGSIFALLLASGVVGLTRTVLPEDALNEWGWRVPFLLALPLGLVGWYIRRRLMDSPEFLSVSEANDTVSTPLAHVLRSNKVVLLGTICIAALAQASYYVCFVYLTIHLQKQAGLSATAATWSTSGAILVALLMLPVTGALSDRLGRRTTVIGSAVLSLATVVPLFHLMTSGGLVAAVLAHLLLAAAAGPILGVVFIALAEQFDTRVRVTGLALSYNLAAVLVGGTSPVISAWLTQATGYQGAPGLFLALIALVALGGALLLYRGQRRTPNAVLAAPGTGHA